MLTNKEKAIWTYNAIKHRKQAEARKALKNGLEKEKDVSSYEIVRFGRVQHATRRRINECC